MINYKLYIKVLQILRRERIEVKLLAWESQEDETIEEKASAICELFDIKTANEYLGWIGTITTPYTPNQPANYPRDAFWTPIPH